MTNYLARYSDTEKKTVMICDDERDLFQLFGKSHQIGIQCNSIGSGKDLLIRYR